MELKTIVEEIQSTWEQFKKAVARQDEEIKKFGEATAETKQKVDKLNDRISQLQDEMQKRIDLLEAKMQRPALGGQEGKPGADPERKAALIKYIRYGVDNLTDVERQKLREIPEYVKALSSISDSEGGYIADEDFRRELITKLRDAVFIRQRATVLETSKGSVGFPVFDYDGDAEWTAQTKPIAEEDVKNAFGKRNFTPHKLARIFCIPQELIDDDFVDIEALITDHFARRFAEIEENAFLNGDGVDKPLGLLQADLPNINSGGTALSSVTADSIFDVIYNVKRQYRARGVFIMHRNAVKHIRKLKDSSGQFLWQPTLTAGEPPMLAGYPLFESEFMPDVSQSPSGKVFCLFGDLSYYWIVDRVDLRVQRLVERYAELDQIGVKLVKRTDAAPVLKEPFTTLTIAN